jgi:hypothetical protein
MHGMTFVKETEKHYMHFETKEDFKKTEEIIKKLNIIDLY